jgi:hypothetical protein
MNVLLRFFASILRLSRQLIMIDLNLKLNSPLPTDNILDKMMSLIFFSLILSTYEPYNFVCLDDVIYEAEKVLYVM